MHSALRKQVLTVKRGGRTFKQRYYLADKVPTRSNRVSPSSKADVHYGMLWAKQANEGVAHALQTIDKMHKVPHDLERIPIKVVHIFRPGVGGSYFAGTRQQKSYIEIAKGHGTTAGDLAHEYGHFLDHKLFGRSGNFGSWDGLRSDKHELSRLMRALYKSNGARIIVKQYKKDHTNRQYASVAFGRYLLAPHEMFARAYAQWISSKSPRMQRDVMHYHEVTKRNLYPSQWEPDDFAPIAREFDRVFKNRGLR